MPLAGTVHVGGGNVLHVQCSQDTNAWPLSSNRPSELTISDHYEIGTLLLAAETGLELPGAGCGAGSGRDFSTRSGGATAEMWRTFSARPAEVVRR